MNKTMQLEELVSHIHCPNCLMGLLIEKSTKLFISDQKDYNAYRAYVYQCSECGEVFKRTNHNGKYGKLKKIILTPSNE